LAAGPQQAPDALASASVPQHVVCPLLAGSVAAEMVAVPQQAAPCVPLAGLVAASAMEVFMTSPEAGSDSYAIFVRTRLSALC
jgi:hypothetical protein